MAVDISATDAAGRVWIKDKRYSSLVDLGAYKTTAALKARDPFQNVYSEIANDLVVARDKLSALDRENIRKVASLKFAEDLAPDAMAGMTAVDKNGITQVVRLPADGGPDARAHRKNPRSATPPWSTRSTTTTRASRSRWTTPTTAGARPASPSSRKKCAPAPSARTRTVLGAAALLASHLRAELLQLLRRLPHQRRHAHRRHHGRHLPP